MTLKLSGEDAQELRKALLAAHSDLLRQLSGLSGCGCTPRGIELCQRRSRTERLLDCLDHISEVRPLPEAADETRQLRVAA